MLFLIRLILKCISQIMIIELFLFLSAGIAYIQPLIAVATNLR
jgi:hypothetical protein